MGELREFAVQLSRKLFQVAWYLVNVLLIVAMAASLYSISWEFSTRRYLKGFSDAIVPATAPGDEKVQAILNWMAHGPARLPYGPSPAVPDRDPTDTLNYDALLQVCGTATNAFINLTSTGNLSVRRLLLVDSNMLTKHVVAEVLVNGRWIIVDPAYRLVLRDAQGHTLTREDLTDPRIFAEATQDIPAYDPTYTFDRTIHVRIGRIHLLGVPLARLPTASIPDGMSQQPFRCWSNASPLPPPSPQFSSSFFSAFYALPCAGSAKGASVFAGCASASNCSAQAAHSCAPRVDAKCGISGLPRNRRGCCPPL